MKENINIEELVKEKFSNFEGNVDPSAWANISQSIGAGGTGGAAGAGLSGLAKVAIVAGTIAVTSVSVWYFSQDDETPIDNNDVAVTDVISNQEEPLASVKKLVVEDTSDPVLHESELEIQEGLGTTPSPEYFEQEVIDLVLSNENNSESGNNTSSDSENTENNNSNNGSSQVDQNEGTTVEEGNGNNVQHVEPNHHVESKLVDADIQISQNDKIVDFVSNAKDHNNVYWEFGDGTTAEGDIVTHEYKRPGTYSVEITVVGTESTLSERREIVIEGTSSVQAQADIYNVITPNNDLRNDYFSIKTKDISTFNIVIRDMSGKEVFSSDDPDFEWNGEKYDGSIEKGNYIYTVFAEGEDGAIFKRAGKLYVKI